MRNINRVYIRKNILTFSIVLFLIIYGTLVMSKPNFLYNKDGSLREFGLGQSRKTIVPAWLIAIIIAILSYFSILYYLAAPHLN